MRLGLGLKLDLSGSGLGKKLGYFEFTLQNAGISCLSEVNSRRGLCSVESISHKVTLMSTVFTDLVLILLTYICNARPTG
jgi:hypothetical protein